MNVVLYRAVKYLHATKEDVPQRVVTSQPHRLSDRLCQNEQRWAVRHGAMVGEGDVAVLDTSLGHVHAKSQC